MQQFTVFSLSPFAIFVALAASPMAHADCNSAASCARKLACPPGADEVSSDGGLACRLTTEKESKNPTCGPRNAENDWKWDAGKKECFRVRKSGDRVTSKENIDCTSGFSYKEGSGKCEKPGSTTFWRPSAVKKSDTHGVPVPPTFDSATAAARELACDGGFSLKASGGAAHCEKTEGGSARAPTCSARNMENDWKWDAAKKECFRVRNSGDRVTSKENIECASGFTYEESDGLCKKPGGTFFDEPKLK